MSKESEFVDLLNREMERLQGFLKGKKEPQTAVECEELVRPFVYKIEELTAHNYIKDQRIAELEEQLKNAIVPKFKIGQEVWFIDTRVNDFNEHKYIIQYFEIQAIRFDNFDFEYEDCWGDIVVQNDLFATKEEAQAKLKELQGDK